MGYARHIGRVGALAVTLGVGAAIANSPGIAYADSTGATTNDNQQNTTTSSTDPDTTTGQPAPSGGTASQGTDDTGSTTSDRKLQRRPVLRAVIGAIRDIADGSFDGAGNAAGATSRLERRGTTGGDSAALRTSTESTTTTTRIRARVDDLADASDDLKSAATSFTQRVEQAVQKYTAPTQVNEVKTTNGAITTAPQTLTTAATPLLKPTTQPRTSVVPFITNPIGALVKPLIYPGPTAPLQLPTLMAVLVAIRDEIERLLVPRSTQVAYPPRTDQPVDPALPDPTKQHVLVIAVDGTNLSEVIQEDDTPNTNFEELMSVSTVSAPSIVGHTSISNPSWTAVLTGAWVERTGVDQHNTFTPWTYDLSHTGLTQLENYNPAIRTKQIGDWDVIGAISASGEGADEVVYIAPQPDDVDLIDADAAVTQATVDTLDPTIPESEVPNFMVTYLAQVDEAGHLYGGYSPEYDAPV